MKIKDVEKLTGLSQRSIRLYEEKGLLEVRRDEDNQYRYYSEEDVERLKLIRVLRYFDFSIEEIGELLSGSDKTTLVDAISKKADSYADKVDDYESKAEQCRAFVKDFKNADNVDALDDYIEMIGSLDDEDIQELKELTKQIEHPSLGATLIWTLILSGPIISGFIWGAEAKLHIVLIAVSSVLLAYEWYAYLRGRSRRTEYQKSRDKGSLWVLPALVICILAMVFAFTGIDAIQGKYLSYTVGSKWILYEMPAFAVYLIIIPLAIISVGAAGAALFRFTGNSVFDFGIGILGFIRKHKVIAVIAAAILLYVGFFSMYVVTEDSLVKYDPLHPQGRSYELSQVKSITTGFNNKGEFYYTVYLKDGKMKLTGGTLNEKAYLKYKDYDYLEFVDLDQKLLELGVPKDADVESIERADYSEDCMENFKKIITE